MMHNAPMPGCAAHLSSLLLLLRLLRLRDLLRFRLLRSCSASHRSPTRQPRQLPGGSLRALLKVAAAKVALCDSMHSCSPWTLTLTCHGSVTLPCRTLGEQRLAVAGRRLAQPAVASPRPAVQTANSQ